MVPGAAVSDEIARAVQRTAPRLCAYLHPPPVDRASVLAVFALIVAGLAVLTSLFVAFGPDVATDDERAAEIASGAEAREASLLVHMVLFQRYLEKLTLAADAGNAPLAAFYAEEIEETAERVMDGGYVDDGVDLSAIAAEVALPRAQALVAAARAGDSARVDSALARMIDGCNQCHRRSDHRWVAIQRPAASAYPSQAFAPVR